MKLSDIIRQVNNDTDQGYTNQEITDWCNRCLDELTPIAQKQVKKTASIVESNSYALPDDLFEIRRVIIKSDQDNAYVIPKEYPLIEETDFHTPGYKMFADELEIQKGPITGTVEMHYIRNLNYLSGVGDTPEIETPFHDLLILYATYQSQYKEEEPQKQSDAFQRYMNRRNEYEQFIFRKKNDVYTIKETYF